MSDDVKEVTSAVVVELAVEHSGFYGDKASKAVKGFFLNELYRSWGHTAQRGWARLLYDRRSSVQVPNAPRHRARANDSQSSLVYFIHLASKKALPVSIFFDFVMMCPSNNV